MKFYFIKTLKNLINQFFCRRCEKKIFVQQQTLLSPSTLQNNSYKIIDYIKVENYSQFNC